MHMRLKLKFVNMDIRHVHCALCIVPIPEIARAGLQKSYYKLQHAWSPTGLLADLRYFRFSKILILSRHSGHDGHMELSDIVGSCGHGGHFVVLNN